MFLTPSQWSILVTVTVASYCWLFYARARVSRKQPSPTSNSKRFRQTHRVRGVPLTWDISRLQAFLASQRSFGDALVYSLATELQGNSRSATAFLGGSKTSGQIHVQNDVMDKPSRPVTLSLDQEFLGITTLFAPGDDDHKLE